jgi:Icc-related predicted phosphoesterase
VKIWLFSDLHMEFANIELVPPASADICVCAGDLTTKGIINSLAWLKTYIVPAMPVVFVAGNHEYYRAVVVESLRDARAFAAETPGLHFLENESVSLFGVIFAGATLWTDFALFGREELAMAAAEAGMNDYKRIKFMKQPYQRFRARHAFRMHKESRTYLAEALSVLRIEKTVVVTHHAPTPHSLSPEFRDDILSAAYASDLRAMIEATQPDLWLHGHIHDAVNYSVGRTRVMSNPRGYPDEPSFRRFDPAFVIEV